MTRIAVLGGSGRLGRLLLEKAVDAGHEVNALARNPSRIPPRSGVNVIAGDGANAADVAGTIAGTEAVLMTLGHARGSPKDILARSAENVIGAMREHGVSRLVNVTAVVFVRGPDEPTLLPFRVTGTVFRVVTRSVVLDSRRQAEAIERSGLDWTLVRAPKLTERPEEGYRVSLRADECSPLVTRGDVAAFMLDQLGDRTYLRQSPIVSN